MSDTAKNLSRSLLKKFHDLLDAKWQSIYTAANLERMIEKHYAGIMAENAKLRRQVELVQKSGSKYQAGFVGKAKCVRCHQCGEVEFCRDGETRIAAYKRMHHHPDCPHAEASK